MLDHKHLLVKAFVKNPPTDESKMIDWMTRLVANVNMKIVQGPFVKYVTAEGNEGLTGAVCIETSHSSFHCWDKAEKPFIQFDLYSCSCFKPESVLKMFEEFDVVSHEWMFIDRNDNLKIISQGSFNS